MSDDCGCCQGLTVETPAAVHNRPGLPAIAYRVGTHAQFKASMLARLPIDLGGLTTRDDDDFTIALIDAWAVVADIVAFYQERIANESYLRTATERQSIINLARLIGYELRPGVAATADLAFTLETGTGSPAVVPLDKGLRVQSVPGPGEKPQTFETVEPVVARPEWNILKPRQTKAPHVEETSALLDGVTTNLKIGDVLLFVEVTKASSSTTRSRKTLPATLPENAEIRRIVSVEPDPDHKRTLVRWNEKLDVAKRTLHVYAMRLRASIFGYNAAQWETLPAALRSDEGAPFKDKNKWAEAKFAPDAKKPETNAIDLDSVYPSILPGSLLVLASSTDAKLFRVTSVVEAAVAAFNLSGKSTHIVLEGAGLPNFSPRNASVYAQSELLPLAPLPDTSPVTGTSIELDGAVTDLPAGRLLLFTDAASTPEPAIVERAERIGKRTKLTLARPGLQGSFERATTSIFANVAPSTHGETVKDEVLGSGDAGQPYQRFALRQSPLTYTPAPTASGGQSTLEVRVNDLLWSEVPTLFGRGPRERIYLTHIDDDGTTTVQFGDGITGARLPMGRENVKATYRKGIGLGGLVRAGQLSLLITKPLGVRGVANPLPSAGAQEPQTLADARANAPVTVLTLDRIVSLLDYEDFARNFAGIGKALATWTWSGHARQVFVTVAGIGGAAVADKSDLQTNLLTAMQKAGDGFVPIAIRSYRKATFKVVASIKIDSSYIAAKVLAAVDAALRAGFSFAARAFGQPVTLSEVVTVMQDVAGVVAVDVTKLFRTDDDETRETFLGADAPRVGAGPGVQPAELLTLDDDGVELTEMP
jgi:predicted phage baseplate assembly protein